MSLDDLDKVIDQVKKMNSKEVEVVRSDPNEIQQKEIQNETELSGADIIQEHNREEESELSTENVDSVGNIDLNSEIKVSFDHDKHDEDNDDMTEEEFNVLLKTVFKTISNNSKLMHPLSEESKNKIEAGVNAGKYDFLQGFWETEKNEKIRVNGSKCKSYVEFDIDTEHDIIINEKGGFILDTGLLKWELIDQKNMIWESTFFGDTTRSIWIKIEGNENMKQQKPQELSSYPELVSEIKQSKSNAKKCSKMIKKIQQNEEFDSLLEEVIGKKPSSYSADLLDSRQKANAEFADLLDNRKKMDKPELVETTEIFDKKIEEQSNKLFRKWQFAYYKDIKTHERVAVHGNPSDILQKLVFKNQKIVTDYEIEEEKNKKLSEEIKQKAHELKENLGNINEKIMFRKTDTFKFYASTRQKVAQFFNDWGFILVEMQNSPLFLFQNINFRKQFRVFVEDLEPLTNMLKDPRYTESSNFLASSFRSMDGYGKDEAVLKAMLEKEQLNKCLYKMKLEFIKSDMKKRKDELSELKTNNYQQQSIHKNYAQKLINNNYQN